jgi:PadR family transcriptional regulator PadR
VTEERPGAAGGARLHGEMLTTSLLAFLKSANAYGYELTQRLSEAGLPPFDSAAVYRTLRQLEASGLVASFWDTSESGPARRIYSLTAAGALFLQSWAGVMQAYQAVLNSALEPFTAPAAPAESEATGPSPDPQSEDQSS